jgi:hypothetical protein
MASRTTRDARRTQDAPFRLSGGKIFNMPISLGKPERSNESRRTKVQALLAFPSVFAGPGRGPACHGWRFVNDFA